MILKCLYVGQSVCIPDRIYGGDHRIAFKIAMEGLGRWVHVATWTAPREDLGLVEWSLTDILNPSEYSSSHFHGFHGGCPAWRGRNPDMFFPYFPKAFDRFDKSNSTGVYAFLLERPAYDAVRELELEGVPLA